MKNKPIISIITPAYNAERYIRRCVESVLHQSFQDWEMHIMDDGSKDETLKIIQDYSSRDSRIIVYHQDNRGYVDTNNILLSKVNSEYFLALDSDNWLANENTFQQIINIINKHNPDIVQLDYYEVVDEVSPPFKVIPHIRKEGYYPDYKSIETGIREKAIPNSSHSGRAIKTALIGDTKLVGDATGSDTRFYSLLLAKSNSLYVMNDYPMCVLFREESLSHLCPKKDFYLKWVSDEVGLFPTYSYLGRKYKKHFPQLITFLEKANDAIIHSYDLFKSDKVIRRKIWKYRSIFTNVYPKTKLFLLCFFPRLYCFIKNEPLQQ